MTSYRPLTSAELLEIENAAHAMRADQFARLARAAGRAIAAPVRKVAAFLVELHRTHVTFSELSALNDRELRDIGLTRADIPAVASGHYVRPSELAPAAAVPAHQDNTAPAIAPTDEDYKIAA
ncbi:DUF1127 domain-containing protein [Amorphus orientalis]|uniref:Uncharacterized protein YjiS (DUF1127 family) n=1 Tax=Amorphus orientalis TaxID=649198 RepID=A0AAE3VM07_9HYPH|nr:uncharacterized protein YjiS (DUF1127 family) [Amorphus orientalis]